MAYKRLNTIANRGLRKVQRRFRKRYVQRRGGLRFGKLARDVATLKSRLNTETKLSVTNVTANAPTVTAPTLYPLNTPDTQGLESVGKRIGAKVRYTYLSGKLRIEHQNFGDKQANATVRMYIIWLKNGEFKSDFEADFANFILNPDQNNQFSPMSYFNKTKYGSWIATWKHTVKCKDLIPVNQVAMGLPTDTGGTPGNDTLNTLGRASQIKYYYVNINKKINVHGEWNNTLSTSGDTDEISRMVPYLFSITDCPGSAVPTGNTQPDSILNDKVNVQGTIRLSYIDN